jgi:hypothetical protein
MTGPTLEPAIGIMGESKSLPDVRSGTRLMPGLDEGQSTKGGTQLDPKLIPKPDVTPKLIPKPIPDVTPKPAPATIPDILPDQAQGSKPHQESDSELFPPGSPFSTRGGRSRIVFPLGEQTRSRKQSGGDPLGFERKSYDLRTPEELLGSKKKKGGFRL